MANGPVNPVVNRNLGLPGNDDRHNQKDYRGGGGPTNKKLRTIPPAKRGGFGQHGQKVSPTARAKMGSGRPSAGNPATRGSVRPVGRQSFPSETRNPNSGGGVQVRDNMDTVSGRGGFGTSGQVDVPGVRTNPQPSAGNLGGRMAKRVIGRFNNKSKGAGGNSGKYGGPPVRLDT